MSGLQKFRGTRFLMWCGVVGPLVFVTVFMIESATRPDYNPLRSMVSELSLSEYGWQQIANFLVSGTLVLAFAGGLRRVSPSGLGSSWGLLLTVTGLGLLVAGVFVCDPGLAYPAGAPAVLPFGSGTWHNMLHSIGGVMVFLSLPAAMLLFARRFAGDRRWNSWMVPTLITTGFAFACFIASNVAAMHGGPAGLFQRMCITTYLMWLAAFAYRAGMLASDAAK